MSESKSHGSELVVISYAQLKEAMGPRKPPPLTRWDWDEKRRVLTPRDPGWSHYEVDLDRFETCKATVDWLFHLSEKGFIDALALGELVYWIEYQHRASKNVATDVYQ